MHISKLFILIYTFLLFSSRAISQECIHNKTVTSRKLTFQIELNPDAYIMTNWAEPPQLAIWLENTNPEKTIKTVWVTERSAKNKWNGKTMCQTCLPIWESNYIKEKGSLPTITNPVPDAYSGATPKKKISCSMEVNEGSSWMYYIEINVSGDFNETYQQYGEMEDFEGNGQPSLIFSGNIVAQKGSVSYPLLIGRSEQFYSNEEMISNLDGITTAKLLIKKIEVKCK